MLGGSSQLVVDLMQVGPHLPALLPHTPAGAAVSWAERVAVHAQRQHSQAVILGLVQAHTCVIGKP